MAEACCNDLTELCRFLMDRSISLSRAMVQPNKFSTGAFDSHNHVLAAGPECDDYNAGELEPDANDMIRVAVAIHRERGDLIRMLIDTIRMLATPGAETLQRLEALEEDLTGAVELDDLRNVKPKLSACLEAIRRESSRPQTPANEPAEPFSPAPERSHRAFPARHGHPPAEEIQVRGLDPVTGLPERHAAEAALELAIRSRLPITPAVIVIDSLPAINMRFGRQTGDALLQAFGDSVVQTLSPEDELFRWTGPAFVAVLRDPLKGQRGASEFARLMEQKFEHTVTTSSRDIHLSPAKRWTILPTNSRPAELFHEIDRFVSPAIGRA
jgi:GGDEF domain-containing protein